MSEVFPPPGKPFRWWQRRARMRAQVQCQHLHADGIYGDEINRSGGKRGYCWSCRTFLDDLPITFHSGTVSRRITMETHQP